MKHNRPFSREQKTSSIKWILVLAPAALMLSGCANNMSDLTQKVDRILARPGGKIEPIPEMKPLPKFSYVETKDRTPFSPADTQTANKGNGITPDMNRSKEPLEMYPLDALAMKGVLERKGTKYALVRDGDDVLHEVQVGNYMGMNYGKVVKITTDKITLEEIVPDGQGGWRKQTAIVQQKRPNDSRG
ncbi:pilus assembly protein PilP [Halothiobacillus sp.]|uniref:pilus assembly protein PilP n=1 Tax=Halothiobacillus sp. TaxID=1891311 RepID=UPI0026152EC9|nr:pilus assembly protein PilP [Halothiobacillus sp.]